MKIGSLKATNLNHSGRKFINPSSGRDVEEVLEELLTHRSQAVVSALKSGASVRDQLTNVCNTIAKLIY